MIKIFKYLKSEEWICMAVSVIFIVMQVWLDLKLPDYMSEITVLVQTKGSAMSEIWKAGGHMLLCALGSLVSSCVVGFFVARIAAGISKRLRSLVYDKVQSFSMEEINHFSTASLITRSTNDVVQVQMFISMGMQVMIKAPIMGVWAILKISGKEWQWSLATGIAILFILVILVFVALFALPRFRKIQGLTDNLNNVTRENLLGMRVVRAYNAEDYQEKKFEEANEELTHNNLVANRVMAIMNPGMSIAMNGLSLSIYWIGAYLINKAALTFKITIFSDMVVFTSYAMQVVMSFMMLTIIFIILPRAAVSAKRILEVFEMKESIKDGDKTPDSNVKGCIEFRDVSFKYPDAGDYVLEHISFSAKQGETVAIIGSTGSGKSTLLNLIPRFYDATEGEVLIDGLNVKDYNLKELRNKLGYVPQKAVLFSGTVENNIDFGDYGVEEKSSEKDIEHAARIAQAEEFIAKMEDGYQAHIAQGGTNVSGGQKQRLSIARAVCAKPEIYLFDDSFSALDYRTDRILRKALREETADVTNIIVAQRIGTIMDADLILVLDEGKMVGKGTHAELMKNCSVYQEIAYSQLSKEELANA